MAEFFSMYELFFKKFNEATPLSEKEQHLIEGYLTPKKLRKKQYLLQEVEVCKHIAFVEKDLPTLHEESYCATVKY